MNTFRCLFKEGWGVAAWTYDFSILKILIIGLSEAGRAKPATSLVPQKGSLCINCFFVIW